MNTKLDTLTVETVGATLEELLPDGRHWTILDLLTVVSCADALQIQQATDLSRDQLNLALQKLGEAAPGLPPILFHPRDRIPRPGQRVRHVDGFVETAGMGVALPASAE